jgi:translation initiation factor 2B subunit (eIF-2B alpha/beta/delta family)
MKEKKEKIKKEKTKVIEFENATKTLTILCIKRTAQGVCVYAKSPKIAKFLKNAAQKQQNINDILAEYFPSLDNNI